jgi:hypothetical protein
MVATSVGTKKIGKGPGAQSFAGMKGESYGSSSLHTSSGLCKPKRPPVQHLYNKTLETPSTFMVLRKSMPIDAG